MSPREPWYTPAGRYRNLDYAGLAAASEWGLAMTGNLLASFAGSRQTGGPTPRPGGIITMRSGAGKEWDTFAFGCADLARGLPNGEDVMWHAASLTKQFTALAVIALCRTNGVALTQRVAELLGDDWRGTDVALHHLLFHTSGLSDEAVTRSTGDIGKVASFAAQLASGCTPGAAFRYASVNYTILALVVEKLAGRPFGDAMRALVFDPARMPETSFDPPARRAVGYSLEHERWTPEADRATVPGPEGAYLSVAELRAWHTALRADGFDPVDRALLDRPGMLDDGSICEYGFGQYVYRYKGSLVHLHPAKDRSVSSLYIRGPGEGRGLIAMANDGRADLFETCWGILTKACEEQG